MKIEVKARVNIDPAKILRSRGMGTDNRVQRMLASDVGRLSKPYVPKLNGRLSSGYIVADDGSTLTYPGPYAHYQWVGEVMGPNVFTKNGWRSMAKKGEKRYTGRMMTHTDPMRGPNWVERMLADRRDDLVRALKAYIKRLGG